MSRLKNVRLYRIYWAMKSRCYNKHYPHYKWYGARGITVCDEWLNDFMSFYNWAINNGYNDNLTLDRINSNMNYTPSNCRWANPKMQARNRRNNKYITINGETHCLKEWCEILNLNYNKIRQRLRYKWSIEKALELEEKP